ncbi:MAG: helix-turn-helix domain-containing protein [Evtepia gabavorous]
MARYIGSAREVVTKVLKYFAQEGIVALRRGTITILDREKLRRLTGMASVEERTPRPQK